MADPRDTAGNLGDAVKHIMIAAVAAHWQDVEPGGHWVETHAGRHVHPPSVVAPDGTWVGDRADVLTAVEAAWRAGADLGPWHEALDTWLPRKTWPGSLAVARAAAPGLRLMGFERNPEAAATFAEASIDVRQGDGWAGARSVPGPKLVLCDPFWDEADTLDRVASLAEDVGRLVVWYPVLPDLDGARLAALGFDVVEVRWAEPPERGLPGAGLALRGLADGGWVAWRAWRRLQAVFAGRSYGTRRLELRGQNWIAGSSKPAIVWG